MINTLDYIYFRKENLDLLEELEHHETYIYDIIYPVIKVLDYYSEKGFETNKNLGSKADQESIFEIGFNYLFGVISVIKDLLNNNFSSDIHKIIYYDKLIANLINLEDLQSDLINKNIEYDEIEIEEIFKEIDSILLKSKKIPDNFELYISDRISKFVSSLDYDDFSITDIFVEIAENLGIYLYDEEDLIIGRDIE